MEVRSVLAFGQVVSAFVNVIGMAVPGKSPRRSFRLNRTYGMPKFFLMSRVLIAKPTSWPGD